MQEFDDYIADLPPRERAFLKLQFRLRKITDHYAFDYSILACALTSAVLLAVEYDGMSVSLQVRGSFHPGYIVLSPHC